jgi:hypothetical protein
MRLHRTIQMRPRAKTLSHRGKRLALAAGWVGLTFSGIAPSALGVTYSIVADTTTTAPGHGAFIGFVIPTLSGSNVAFQGNYSGGQGIYTGTVGATGATKVVDTDDIAPGHGAFTGLGITATLSGSNLAFHGAYSGGSGIYTGTMGATGAAKIVDVGDTAPGHGLFSEFGNPSVSGSNVAFRGTFAGGLGIYTGTVGAGGAAKVVETGDIAPGHGAFTDLGQFATVNGSNVVFIGSYSGGNGIYAGSVGATGAAKVVDFGNSAPGHGAFTGFNTVSVSGSNLAFQGLYSGGQGIYTGSVGATGAAKVVDTGDTAPGHGAFTSFGATPSLSGSNVAFAGFYSGGQGIYLVSGGAGGSLSAVLNSGDPLFGSTVSSLNVSPFAYDNNAIAFSYTLANGRSGIGVAIVPEPASLGVMALGGLTLLRRRPRGREWFRSQEGGIRHSLTTQL